MELPFAQTAASRIALRVSLSYAFIAAMWVLLSDTLIATFVLDSHQFVRLQTLKGWGFVAITSVLLHVVLRRALTRWMREAAKRKRVEAKLHQLSHVVEQSPASVIITDLNGKIEYVNPRFTDVTGFTPEEVIGRNPRILKSGSQSPDFYRELWQTISAGKPWRGELHNRKKNGELFWESASISPILSDAGIPTHFVAIKEDITQRKHTEKLLAEREEQFRMLIENAPDLITTINNAGVMRFQSPACRRMLGYEPDELCGRSAMEFVHPEDAPRIIEAIQLAVMQPHKAISVEYRFRHHDGSWRTLESIGRSIPEQADEGFIVVNSRDITENRTLEQQFRQAQKMECVGQLAGGVAHDFNNVLVVINGHAELIKMKGNVDEEIAESVQQISLAGERAAALTRQLLTFSRKQIMQPRDIKLNQVIQNLTKMLRRVVTESVTLRVEAAPDLPPVHADIGMMEQILMNLAVNARDAMPRGGKLTITTSLKTVDETVKQSNADAKAGDYVCIRVEDTGCGIPAEIRTRVFEPFFTTKEDGKGTGLGLATVYGIVQQHGGWISLESEPGKGTAFSIHLPAVKKVVYSAETERFAFTGLSLSHSGTVL